MFFIKKIVLWISTFILRSECLPLLLHRLFFLGGVAVVHLLALHGELVGEVLVLPGEKGEEQSELGVGLGSKRLFLRS